jgi:ferredoxin-NADP reductase
MARLIHPIAGTVAFVTIATFWLSTVLVELLGGPGAVTTLKTAIPWGFLLLIPAIAATGGSGLNLSKGRRRGVIGAKLKRMPIIAANGLAVLIPSAFFLASKARAGQFDAAFYAVQALELVAGATNLTLLGLSMRDGLALTAWRRNGVPRPVPMLWTSLLSTQDVATGTVALTFTRPAGFRFSAGQAVYLTLAKTSNTDEAGRVRTFSIASAPHESDLMIATRRSDTSFKRALLALTTGSRVTIEGPCGNLSLHEDPGRPAVLIAGGIGVTPFRSLILDAAKRGLPHRLFLFYSNRTAAEAAFLAELNDLQRDHPRLTVIPTITGADGPLDLTGETGSVTTDMLQRHLLDLSAPVYYLAGPPAMVAAMQRLLTEAGVRGADVRAEAFPGY